MRVLFATGSATNLRGPKLLPGDHVFCGPACIDRQIGDEVCSISTAFGQYGMAEVARTLRGVQKPDVLIVEASSRNLPRNVNTFDAVKVLLIGDTYSEPGELRTLLTYAKTESFDRIILIDAPEHAEAFRLAGFDPFWLPSITFPHTDESVRVARMTPRLAQLAVSDAKDHIKPWPLKLLKAVTAANLPLRFGGDTPETTLRHFGVSTLGLNLSVAGELSFAFEIIASGAVLLTDQLGVGLRDLWRDQVAVTYTTPSQLVEVAGDYTKNPERAAALGAQATQWFDREYSEQRRSALFANVVFDGRAAPQFTLPRTPSASVAVHAIPAEFDALQVVHRDSEIVRVSVGAAVPTAVHACFSLLPRIAVHAPSATAPTGVDVLVAGVDELPASKLAGLRAVWCWNVAANRERAALVLSRSGFTARPTAPGWFERLPLASREGTLATKAQAALEDGFYGLALELAQTAAKRDSAPGCAHLVLAELALEAGNPTLFRRLTAECRLRSFGERQVAYLEIRAAAGAPIRAFRRLAEAYRQCGETNNLQKLSELAKCAMATGRSEGTALFLRCALQMGRWEAALNVLAHAARKSAIDPEPLLDAALLATRAGMPADGLAALLHADALWQGAPEIGLAIGYVAAKCGLYELASEALHPVAAGESLQVAAKRLLAKLPKASIPEQSPPRDLLVCHGEVTRLHGTGVLVQRMFPGAAGLVTLRSHSLYGGVVELDGTHLVFCGTGLSLEQRTRQLGRLLRPFRIRRILAIPYGEEEYLNALVASDVTGAPLCTYVMDDQIVYGEVSPAIAEAALRRSKLRLVISPEMRDAYEARFGGKCVVMPPLVESTAARVENRWTRASGKQAVLVGNIWSETQFLRLRAMVKGVGLQLDWFGNKNLPFLIGKHAELEQEGIVCRGFVPEAELAARVSEYGCVIVPSGMLDGTEKDEWLTRLSLPSRMVFILCQTLTPMLVLGHPDCCAARFVERLGIGCSCGYEVNSARKALGELLDPSVHDRLVARSRAVANAFVMPDSGQWIWRSLSAGAPVPAPFITAFESAVIPQDSLLPKGGSSYENNLVGNTR